MDTKNFANAGAGGQGNGPPDRKLPGAYPCSTEEVLPEWTRAVLIAIFRRFIQLLGPAPDGLQIPDSFIDRPPATVNAAPVGPASVGEASVCPAPALPAQASYPVAPAATTTVRSEPPADTYNVGQAASEPPRYYAVFVGREVGVLTEWYVSIFIRDLSSIFIGRLSRKLHKEFLELDSAVTAL